MKRIINNIQEIADLTGNHFPSGRFSTIRADIDLETETIIRLIGQEVFEKALNLYIEPSEEKPSPEQNKIVQHVQLPIATMAALRYYQSTLVTHGDNGRKVQISSHEKMAWEWMIEADDMAQLRKAQAATDRLINYLEKEEVPEWLTSDARTEARSLFVNSTELFQRTFPIDNSPTFFYTVTPFLRIIQNTEIRPQMGDDYPVLLESWRTNSVSEEKLPLLELIQQAMILLAMGMASRRLSIQVLPESVVQIFRTQSVKSSKPAFEQAIQRFREDIMEEGLELLDKAKRLRTNSTEKPVLLPENSPENKYMRT